MSYLWTGDKMNEIETLETEIQQYNEQCIRIQTLIDQASNTCKQLQDKYGIANEQEFKALVDKAQLEYNNKLNEVRQFLEQNKPILEQAQELINGRA